MPGAIRHGILSGVRSQRKLRTPIPAEELETPKLVHRRQHSDSATVARPLSTTTRSDYSGHWPPIEFDPLKLNPPVREARHAPPRLHDRQPLQCLRSRRSFASAENRRPPRLHHSDSGLTLQGYREFDFALEKETGLQHMVDRNRQQEHDVEIKGWPSPASSVDSGKSWFEDDDDDETHDDDETAAPVPRRRPVVGSPNDLTNFLQRGEWKRRAIFFGVQTEEVHTKEHDAFDV